MSKTVPSLLLLILLLNPLTAESSRWDHFNTQDGNRSPNTVRLQFRHGKTTATPGERYGVERFDNDVIPLSGGCDILLSTAFAVNIFWQNYGQKSGTYYGPYSWYRNHYFESMELLAGLSLFYPAYNSGLFIFSRVQAGIARGRTWTDSGGGIPATSSDLRGSVIAFEGGCGLNYNRFFLEAGLKFSGQYLDKHEKTYLLDGTLTPKQFPVIIRTLFIAVGVSF